MVLQKYSIVGCGKKVLDERLFNKLKYFLSDKQLFIQDVMQRDPKGWIRSNKKGGEVSTFFAPNLTMNLTYLCYGTTKVHVHSRFLIKKTLKSVFHR